MTKTVCIIQGHPHGKGKHLCHAIAEAYADGAKKAGAEVSRIDLGNLDIPMLRDPADFLTAPLPAIDRRRMRSSARNTSWSSIRSGWAPCQRS